MQKLLYTIVILLLLLNVSSNNLSAQTGWRLLPDIGLTDSAAGRYDDVWFFNLDTGLVVSGGGHIYKTYDGGTNWYPKLFVNTSCYFRSIEFLDDHKTGIAGTLFGTFYRTNDAGETWQDITANLPDTGLDKKQVCGLAHFENTFYGVGWWGAKIARFYKSTDSGRTWNTTYIDTALATSLVDVVFLSSHIGFATGCKYHNYYFQESVVLKTLDGGQTWKRVFSDKTIGGRIWKIQFVNRNTAYASIEPEFYPDTVAVIKTTDVGETWQIMPVGKIIPYEIGTQGVGFINPEHGWVGGYYEGMFETYDGGQNWQYINSGRIANRYFKVDNNTMYLSGFRVSRYDNFPENVTPQTNNYIPKNSLSAVYPNPSSGEITISFTIGVVNNVRLEVVDLDGKKVYPIMSERVKSGHYTYKWDGSHIPAGNYMVWLGTDEAPYAQKFVLKK